MRIALVGSDSSNEILIIILIVFTLFAISLLLSASHITFPVANDALLRSLALVALHAIYETVYSAGDIIEAV